MSVFLTVKRNTVSFDNVINCRPPKNRTPIWQEVECCRPRRIKTIEQAKPRLIVGLGAVLMHALLGTLDMAGMRGRLFAIKVGFTIAGIYPHIIASFILRTAFDKRKPLEFKLGHCFRMDIQKAFDIVSDLEPIHIDTEQEIRSNVQTFNGSGGEKEFFKLLEKCRQAKVKAVDIETKGLRPYSHEAAIMAVGFSFEETNFLFVLDHPKGQWTDKQRERILEELTNILSR